MEPSAGIATETVELEWLGAPADGVGGAGRRVRLRKVSWVDSRPLYVIDVDVTMWELIAESTLRSLGSLLAFGGEFLRVAAAGEESLLMLAHELGTATAPLLNYEFILRRRMIGDAQLTGYLDGFSASCKRWEDLIQRVQDYARIVNNEQLPISAESVDCYEMVSDVADSWRAYAANRGVLIEVGVQENLKLATDARLVRSALSVIVANAVNASARSSEVRIVVEEIERGVSIIVEDSGSGMSDADAEAFLRGELKRQVVHRGGLGLGQLLLRAYAGALRGVTVYSHGPGGRGMRIGIVLPRDPGPEWQSANE
jgi:signal transduction histidine kinase